MTSYINRQQRWQINDESSGDPSASLRLCKNPKTNVLQVKAFFANQRERVKALTGEALTLGQKTKNKSKDKVNVFGEQLGEGHVAALQASIEVLLLKRGLGEEVAAEGPSLDRDSHEVRSEVLNGFKKGTGAGLRLARQKTSVAEAAGKGTAWGGGVGGLAGEFAVPMFLEICRMEKTVAGRSVLVGVVKKTEAKETLMR